MKVVCLRRNRGWDDQEYALKVLIVESSHDLALLWKRHLERTGAQVRIVGSQEAADEVLQRQGFDVIILDLMLDDGSGA